MLRTIDSYTVEQMVKARDSLMLTLSGDVESVFNGVFWYIEGAFENIPKEVYAGSEVERNLDIINAAKGASWIKALSSQPYRHSELPEDVSYQVLCFKKAVSELTSFCDHHVLDEYWSERLKKDS